MFKEKYEKAKTFVKEHKAEIITGVICVGTVAVLGMKLRNSSTPKNGNQINSIIPEIPKDVMNDVDYLKRRVMNITDVEIRMDNLFDIANNSLKREAARITFEIEELENYIANLDHTKTINVFHRIPEKEKMINDLKLQLDNIKFDKNIIKDMMIDIWGEVPDEF